MEISNLIPHIEALIFASDKPLNPGEITDLVNQAFGFMEDKIVSEQVEAALQGIVEKYDSEFYPFEVKQSGGGWQFLTKKDYHKTVAQLNGEKFLKRLSAAALETLAIIAYKQPVTKGEIEAIRGVSSDYAVQKLLEKELVVITGRNEKLPGHPLVYATSKNFMDYFGINSPEDLPRIKEVLADQIVQPTIINHTEFEQSEVLAVSDNGELIASIEDGTAENPLNGHVYLPNDETNSEVEDLPTEEAVEEFITDEIFIEGDEADEIAEAAAAETNDVDPDELEEEEQDVDEDEEKNNDQEEEKQDD
jgi:segregation and condensation protein B